MIKTDTNFFEYESIGEYASGEIWIHPERIIDSFEIIFVNKGCVYINENDTEYEIGENQFIILEPGKRHFGYKHSITDFYWLHFRTNLNIPCKEYKGNEFYDIKYLLKKLLHMSKTPSYNKNSLDTVAFAIFNEISATLIGGEGNALANKISEYIRININKNITVKSISQHFQYNRDYIGKLFKNAFGIGIKEYIASEKIKIAKDMLLTTNLSVKEIASKLNFENENLFVKFFVYHEKLSPSKFRNKYFNIHMNNE